ncbi:MAG: hypothetical protein AAFR44_07480 [Pseudomonadota bacterium]
MPEITGYGRWLIDQFLIMRPVRAGAMGGMQPVTWQEVQAFCAMTSRVDPGRDAERLFELSRAFVEGDRLGQDVFALSPMQLLEAEE